MSARRAGLGAVGALVAAGGLLLGAAPAGADTSGGGGSGAGSSAGGAAGGANALGGYTLTATGSGMSVFYEQPNLPIPATPSAEADLGYSTATFDAGPTGQSLASVFWPGEVAANGASQLNLLLDPYLEPYFGSNTPTLPNPGPWPLQASAAFPQGPDAKSNDNGTVTMDAATTDAASTATSALGALGGTGSVPAGMVSAQTVGSAVQSTVDSAGDAVAQATSSAHDVSIAGGLVTVGQVTSNASATSDGNQATVNGSSTVAQVSVAGQAVTVDSSGVHTPASPSPIPVLGALSPSVSQVLATAGITMTLTNPTDTVDGPSGERQLDGLQVVIDLTTFDKGLAKLTTMLPGQLASQIEQLPLPLPNAQTLTIDLGWINVNSAASPSFDASGGDGGGLAGLPLSSGGPGAAGLSPTGDGGGFTPGTPGTPATPGTAGGSPSGGAGTAVPAALTTAPAALFKGIGAGLIVLGLVLAGLLALVLLRADRAVAMLGAGPVCTGEDLGGP